MTFVSLLLATLCLSGRTTKDVPVYSPNEEMTFIIRPDNLDGRDPAKLFLDWRRTGDDGKCETGKVCLAEAFTYRTSLDRPGFVRLQGRLLDDSGKPVVQETKGRRNKVICDLGAGVDIDKILPAVPEPADFDAFWTRHRELLASVPWKGLVTLKPIASPTPGVKLFEFSVPCYGGKPTTGHLSIPEDSSRKYAAIVKFFGYNESWTYSRSIVPPKAPAKTAIGLYVSAHGFEMGHDEAYYKAEREKVKSNGFGHGFDPEQNADPDRSYYAGMTYRIMRALEFVKSLPEWNGKSITVNGGSQGGMQSVWAAALDHDVTMCKIYIPWNCDIGGTELGRNRGDWYVKWVPALGYYDTCNLAARIPKSCTVNVTMAGLGDYICPPTGVMAFYNRLAAPKTMTFFQNMQHGNRLEDNPQKFTLEGGR